MHGTRSLEVEAGGVAMEEGRIWNCASRNGEGADLWASEAF